MSFDLFVCDYEVWFGAAHHIRDVFAVEVFCVGVGACFEVVRDATGRDHFGVVEGAG